METEEILGVGCQGKRGEAGERCPWVEEASGLLPVALAKEP